METDVIVIGAGAAGLMCGIEAGRRGRSVLVLDHSRRPAQKVGISGGGRCNFTNLSVAAEHYSSRNPHFCKSAISRFTPGDIMGMLDRHRVRYQEEEEGRLFCSDGAAAVVRTLLSECESQGVKILFPWRILEVDRKDRFLVKTDHGVVTAESLVVATGGLSWPRLGATDLGFRIAGSFGLSIEPVRPGLVPLTLAPRDLEFYSPLSGVSLDVAVSAGKARFRGNMLFTHRGLSGPAILQASSYWREGEALTIDLLPERDAYGIFSERRKGGTEMRTLLSRMLPTRFAETWSAANIPSRPMNQYSDRELREIAGRLHAWKVAPSGTEGFAKAEVTLGGVDTRELSSRTMEARVVPGLFFAGEVVDVTGHLGGFNLHWAWASGYAAGKHA